MNEIKSFINYNHSFIKSKGHHCGENIITLMLIEYFLILIKCQMLTNCVWHGEDLFFFVKFKFEIFFILMIHMKNICYEWKIKYSTLHSFNCKFS